MFYPNMFLSFILQYSTEVHVPTVQTETKVVKTSKIEF